MKLWGVLVSCFKPLSQEEQRRRALDAEDREILDLEAELSSLREGGGNPEDAAEVRVALYDAERARDKLRREILRV